MRVRAGPPGGRRCRGRIDRASLYYYVGTKEELLVALIEQPAYTMTRHCREALESDAPADEKLRRALRAYIEDLATSPEVFLLFSESQHLATISEARDIVTNADAYGKTLLAIVEEGIVFRRLPPRSRPAAGDAWHPGYAQLDSSLVRARWAELADRDR